MSTAAHVSSTPSSFTSVMSCSIGRRGSSLSERCSITHQSRRVISLSVVFLHFSSLSNEARSASILDKYVKKKKLDPLEAYIPAVILTEMQIKELGQNLEGDEPKFSDCRNLLRRGPASSLRVNIRAVAQYASDAGNGKNAFSEVDQCLRALEELDSLLLRASRNESQASVESMKEKVGAALNALNGLLETVPVDVLDKGKAMADAYATPREDEYSSLDHQLKQLEKIL